MNDDDVAASLLNQSSPTQQETVAKDDKESSFCRIFTQNKSRWHTFACVLLAASAAGTSYAFGIFSQVLRNKLSLSQADLSIISSCGSSGLYTQVITGQLMERFGPHMVLYLGSLLIFGGNLWIWLAVQKLLPHSVGALSVIWFFAQVGIACASSTCLVVSLRVFPTSVRGRIAGISKAYFGISSAILASIASGFFGEGSVDFILFVAIALPLVLVFAGLNANFLPDSLVSFNFELSRGKPTHLSPFIAHLLLLFVSILAIGATGVLLPLPRTTRMVLGTIVAVIVFSVLALPSWYGSRYAVDVTDDKTVPLTDEDCIAHETNNEAVTTDNVLHISSPIDDTHEDDTGDYEVPSLLISHEERSMKTAPAETTSRVSFHGRHLPLSEVVKDWRLYVLMMIFVIIAGSGLLVINNIQAVARAVHQKPSNFFVTVVSLANAAGRLCTGIFSDAVRKHGISRLQILTGNALLMALAQFLLSFGQPELLYVCLLIVGFMFGSAFSNISAITADLWGAKYVGSNYGFVDLSPIIGSYAFSTGLIAALYRSDDDNGDDDNDSCVGRGCFEDIFIITAISGLWGTVLSYLLHWYTPLNHLHD